MLARKMKLKLIKFFKLISKKNIQLKILENNISSEIGLSSSASVESLLEIVTLSIESGKLEKATKIGDAILLKSPSEKERVIFSKIITVCAFRAECANDLKVSADAYYLAYMAINDTQQLYSKYLQIKLFHLLREKLFTEARAFFSDCPSGLTSPDGNSIFTPPFVEVASEFEHKEDFESSIACYELALEFKCADSNIIKDRIIAQHQQHLKKLIDNGLYEKAVNFKKINQNKYANFNLEVLNIISVKDFCLANSLSYIEIKSHRNITKPRLHFFGESVSLESLCGDLVAPPQYAATIPNCIASPRGNSLIVENFLISDLAANKYSKNIILGDLNIEKDTPLIIANDSNKALIDIASTKHQGISSGLMMFGVQSKNYGHWVCEFLPRMLSFDTNIFNPNIPIYIDDNMPDSHIESLELLNSMRRQIIKIPKSSVHFSEIGVAPVPAFFPLETKIGSPIYDTVWPKDIFNELKSKIISAVAQRYPVSTQNQSRIFISRKNYNLRQLVNEREIINFLREYGFQVIFPEELTFAEQVILFSNAEAVIGSCSSALTNCLFCPTGCKIIGLIHESASFNFRGYSSFIEAGGANITFLRGSTTARSNINEFHNNYEISIDKLKNAIEEILPKAELLITDIKTNIADEFDGARSVFDKNYFSKKYPQLGRGFGLWMYREKYERGLNPSPLFDDLFYRSQLHTDIESGTALDHYLKYGVELALDPSPFFSTKHYLEAYPDIKKSKINPLVHFLQNGMREGLLPIPMDHPNLRKNSTEIFENDPGNEHARAWVISFNVRDGLLNEAINSIHRVNRIDEKKYIINVALFTILIELEQAGRRSEAVVAYQKLLEFSPNSSFFRYQLAVILRSWGDINGAERQLDLGKQISADVLPKYYIDSLQMLRNERLKGEALRTKAIDFLHKNKNQDARKIFEQINAVNPDLLEPHEQSSLQEQKAKNIKNSNNQHFSHEKSLLIIDTIFPSKFSSFRFGEFLNLLENIPESRVMSSVWDTPQLHASTNYFDILNEFGATHEVLQSRVGALHQNRDFGANLVYTVFLNNAALLWQEHPKMRETRGIFTLYPGGGFALNDRISDIKLRKLCDDNRLRKIITTQKTTKDYLIKNSFCESDKILHIFGGIVPSAYKPLKLRNSLTSDVLNVCFVAQRYSEMGVEKGGDVFAKVANIFKNSTSLKFHFVGDWSAETFDMDFGKNTFFHGVQKAHFFDDFYSRMDIIVSPNVSNYEMSGAIGSFDGFPTTACVEAGLAGVAMFLSDSLGQNFSDSGTPIFHPSSDFELITRDVDHICALLHHYTTNRDALQTLGQHGQAALQRVFAFEAQMTPRINLFRSELASCPTR